MVGKRDDEILAPEDATELIQLKQSVMETGQPVRQEIKVKVNDTWLYFVVSFDPVLDSSGDVTGLICAAFDITAQRTLEMIQRENEIRMATQQRLMQTRENERIKIAREIHDGPLQTFMGLTFDLYNVKEEIADQTIKLKIGALEASLKSGLKELRQSINELRQQTLTNIKLTEAIQERITVIHKKLPELELSVDLDEAANSLPEELSLTLYRISQESLQNLIRHSKATRAGLHLRMENHSVTLIIEDNGKGFSITDDFAALVAEKHYGLAGMKERAEAAGGMLQVSSAPGKGTKIKVDIPV
jgi:signal transduction histidine kinase